MVMQRLTAKFITCPYLCVSPPTSPAVVITLTGHDPEQTVLRPAFLELTEVAGSMIQIASTQVDLDWQIGRNRSMVVRRRKTEE